MSIPRGTTPTFTLTFSDEALDLTLASQVFVSFRSGRAFVNKTGDALTVMAKTIEVTLTQAETLAFGEGDVEIQANWRNGDGSRIASNVVVVDMSKQLLKRVI